MRPKIVLFGDSITEGAFGTGGWASDLAHHFSRSADVVLRGYSGYNTRWALRVMGEAMDGVAAAGVPPPRAVTVFFGANDASLADRSSGYQHVPIGEYGRNLRAICSSLKERWPGTVVVLITPPPVDEDGRIKNPYGGDTSGLPERTNESAGAYAKACIAVAKESGFPVIDIWSKMQHTPGWEKSFLSLSPQSATRKNEVAGRCASGSDLQGYFIAPGIALPWKQNLAVTISFPMSDRASSTNTLKPVQTRKRGASSHRGSAQCFSSGIRRLHICIGKRSVSSRMW